MPSVLIVCTANICRSPMAEAILKQLVTSRQDADQWRIESAGTWAHYGSPSAPGSQYAMEMMGMNISTHQSKPVTLDLIKQFDLILTMEANQKEALSAQFDQFRSRIFMISEMAGLIEDIPDPIGGELEDYQETAKKISRLLTDGLDQIYQWAINPRKEIL